VSQNRWARCPKNRLVASGNHNSTGERSGRGCAARRGAKAALALAWDCWRRFFPGARGRCCGCRCGGKGKRVQDAALHGVDDPDRREPVAICSFDGFEVLPGFDEDTNWWIDALRRGLWLEEKVMPGDWLPRSPVPYTVIIDDTDLDAVPTSPIHSQAITFHAPADMLTWGQFQATSGAAGWTRMTATPSRSAPMSTRPTPASPRSPV